jgi:hypothetical protein
LGNPLQQVSSGEQEVAAFCARRTGAGEHNHGDKKKIRLRVVEIIVFAALPTSVF